MGYPPIGSSPLVQACPSCHCKLPHSRVEEKPAQRTSREQAADGMSRKQQGHHTWLSASSRRSHGLHLLLQSITCRGFSRLTAPRLLSLYKGRPPLAAGTRDAPRSPGYSKPAPPRKEAPELPLCPSMWLHGLPSFESCFCMPSLTCSLSSTTCQFPSSLCSFSCLHFPTWDSRHHLF